MASPQILPDAHQIPAAQQPTQNASATSASLYVGDLVPEVNEQHLFEVFREVGPVLSIRVCRDRVTRRSLGYAYVNFQNAADADRTIDALNFMKIKGKPCRIMWAQRDPSLRKTGRNNIFIKSLAKDIDNKTLHDTFSQFGTILSCKVKMTPEGESAGYGFVHFDSEDAAKAAIKTVDGKLLNDQLVTVTEFIPRNRRQIADPETSFTNIYIKNLNPNVTAKDLEEVFGEFGKILSAAISTTTTTDSEGREVQISKGFAFVNFDSHESAVAAVAALHDSSDNKLAADEKEKDKKKKLYVARAQKKYERQKRRDEAMKKMQEERSKYANLYVKHLPDDYTDEQLRNLFGEFGNIISAKIMTDPETGLSRGFGFVCFENSEDANRAMTAKKDQMIGNKPLYINLAQKKEVRQNQLSTQFQQRVSTLANPGFSMPMNQFSGANMNFMNPVQMQQMQMMMLQNPAFQQMLMQQMMTQGRRPQSAAVPSFPYQASGLFGGGGRGGQQGGRRTGAPTTTIPAVTGRPTTTGVPPTGAGGPAAAIPAAQPKRSMQQTSGPIPNNANVSFTSGARNLAPRVPTTQAMPPIPTSNLASQLASMSEEEAKAALGERLYMRVQTIDVQLAAKITGMLLELDNTELLNLLEDQNILSNKIAEAKQVLEQAGEVQN